MFKNLGNLGYQRNWKEAIGFYIVYFVAMVVVAAILGAMVAAIFLPASAGRSGGFAMGVRLGLVMAIIATLVLSFSILAKKNLLHNFGFILLALLAGLLAVAGGGLLGLIPVAYLTTRPIQAQSYTQAKLDTQAQSDTPQ